MDKKLMQKLAGIVSTVLVLAIFLISGKLTGKNVEPTVTTTAAQTTAAEIYNAATLDDIPEYSGDAYVIINDNIPNFSESDMTTKSYENYGKLDKLGRCTTCMACIGEDLMPKGKRGSISEVKPTGWQSVQYDFVDGKSLYNRSHLIAYQLAGEGANKYNLITGTRHLNADVMRPFEETVGNYVRETHNHVMYRVTPVFKGSELVARGVHMEAMSVEDKGQSIQFNIYCYNVQPNVEIDYKTGKSRVVGNN